MTAKLIVRGLSAGYGAIRVLEAIDLEVPAGKLTVIVGPNGAGKTTLLRALAGLIPREGEVAVRRRAPADRAGGDRRDAAWRWCRRVGSSSRR